jgi:hypothetical protein
MVLRNLMRMVALVPASEELREMEANELLAPALYQRLQEGPHPLHCLVDCMIAIWMNTCAYTEDICESLLFYRGAQGGNGEKSLLRLWYDSAMACGDAHGLASNARMVVTTIKAQSPHLAARMDEEIRKVYSNDKDRRCAYPGCAVTQKGPVVTCVKMMKCGRCLAVYYCCKDHQTAHWREHKRDCVAAAK